MEFKKIVFESKLFEAALAIQSPWFIKDVEFNVDAKRLDIYIDFKRGSTFKDSLKKGLDYYLNNFFYDSKIPKCYDKKIYPIDCIAAAQSLLTLSRFRNKDLAQNVALWIIDAMQDSSGFFYYRKYENFTRKTSFMRWSDAWMFAGLSAVLVRMKRPL